MRRMVLTAAIAALAIEGLAAGQTKDVNQVLAAARTALGGDKIASVKTLTAVGRTLRTTPSGTTNESEFEMAMALPDKYLMRSVMVSMGNMSVFRNAGFNGGQAIDEIDRPPNLQGGSIMIRMAGPGGAAMDPAQMTPEQKAEMNTAKLLANQKEYAKLLLGMFAAAPQTFPLEFSYAGEAESADGKADVISVKGAGDFRVSMFIDQQTHMPLMLSWTDKEPLVMTTTTGGPGPGGGGGGTSVSTTMVMSSGGGGAHSVQGFAIGGGGAAPAGGQQMSKEDMEKFQKDMEERRKEAEAKRRMVEYRVYYTEYKTVGGVKIPFRIQRSIDGKTTEEMLFDTVKMNPKVDLKKFDVAK